MGKKIKKRDHRTSGGGRKAARINQQITRIKMKIKRWERYVSEIKSGTRNSSALRWDTSGLKRHLELLQSM